MTKPLLSIILLNHNNSGYTVPCIRSIQETLTVPYEIIVVDNGSTDNSIEELSRIGDIKLVVNKVNRGFTGGNNDGVRIAAGDYIMILNNDTILYGSNLNKLPDILKERSPLDVIGGKIVSKDTGSAQTAGGSEPNLFQLILYLTVFCYGYINVPRWLLFWFSDWTGDLREGDWASGCFFVMRRDLYLSLGGFDENIFIYLDEIELHKRVRQRGGRIYLYSNLIIQHYGSVTWKGKSHIGVKHVYHSAKYFLEKHKGRIQKSVFVFIVKSVNLLYLPVIFLLTVISLGRFSKLNEGLKICKVILLG